MEKQRKKIFIGLPVAVSAKNRTIESVYNLAIPEGYETTLRIVEGYTVDTARNRIIEEALKDCADYILFVDSDVILPKDTIIRLLNINCDIATGWYIKKVEGGIAELFNPVDGTTQLGNILEKNIPRMGVFDVQGCGFGCTLIDSSLCRKIKDAEGICFEYRHNKNGMCSEDLDFCEKAIKLGAKIKFDAQLRCGHIGDKVW